MVDALGLSPNGIYVVPVQVRLRVPYMVGVAQLVEHWTVAPVVAGSSPVPHPKVYLRILILS